MTSYEGFYLDLYDYELYDQPGYTSLMGKY